MPYTDNLCVGGTAVSGGYYASDPTYAPGRAFDADLLSTWASSLTGSNGNFTTSTYIGYAMSSPQTVALVEIYLPANAEHIDLVDLYADANFVQTITVTGWLAQKWYSVPVTTLIQGTTWTLRNPRFTISVPPADYPWGVASIQMRGWVTPDPYIHTGGKFAPPNHGRIKRVNLTRLAYPNVSPIAVSAFWGAAPAGVNISAPVASVSVAAPAPTISVTANIDAVVASVSVAAPAPAVVVTANVDAVVASVSVAAPAPAISAGASVAPVIGVTGATRSRLSHQTGATKCTITFRADQDIVEWEARADGYGHGQGDLVGSGVASISASTDITFDVDDVELTWGDRDYRINIYAKNAAGQWTAYEGPFPANIDAVVATISVSAPVPTVSASSAPTAPLNLVANPTCDAIPTLDGVYGLTNATAAIDATSRIVGVNCLKLTTSAASWGTLRLGSNAVGQMNGLTAGKAYTFLFRVALDAGNTMDGWAHRPIAYYHTVGGGWTTITGGWGAVHLTMVLPADCDGAYFTYSWSNAGAGGQIAYLDEIMVKEVLQPQTTFDLTGYSSNLVLGKTLIAAPGIAPAAAFDGNDSTFTWSGGADYTQNWMGVDFGSAVAPRVLRLLASSGSGVGLHFLEYSDNGSTWTHGAAVGLGDIYTAVYFALPDLGAHRYWRLHQGYWCGSNIYFLSEASMYALL